MGPTNRNHANYFKQRDEYFSTKIFVAMTNLHMQLGGGNVERELVLLDILVRLDIHSHVDALVGVIATGEVKLWK